MNTQNEITQGKEIPFTNNTETPANSGVELGVFYPLNKDTEIKEVNGLRAVTCRYRNTGSKETRHSVYTYVPTAHLTESIIKDNFDKLSEYFLAFLQDAEDKIIKQKHNKGESRIYTEYLDLDKIITYLEEQELGARLSSQLISNWFHEHIADTLILTIADKLGIEGNANEEQASKVSMYVKQYCAKFESLSGTKTVLPDNEIDSLKNVINLAEAGETTVGKRLISRLEKMVESKQETLFAL